MSAPRRLDRGWFRIAILTASAAVVAGVLVAVVGYRAGSAPTTTVTEYYAALRRGDAPAALALGSLPAGPRGLLTSQVLAAQQRIAPMSAVRVVSVEEHGSRASVRVSYQLAFPGAPHRVQDTLALDRHDGRWRLRQVAVATTLRVVQASERASVLGAPVPDGPVLLFPGAVPVTFDTPDLDLAPSVASIGLTGPASLELNVSVSPAGRKAVLAAAATQLDACLRAGAEPRCPLPSDRYVPGSVRATVVGQLADGLKLAVGAGSRGSITISGQVTVTGSWEGLTFDNAAQPGHGQLELPVAGTVYVPTTASAPRVIWQETS
ncbi:MAG: hypothetical protein EPN43_06785 [Jatrophihabitans sp.]|nr:MAG: hypothetical protein EPN43_06785 [Jatrophihabitans sp.]